ncbi:MAG: hypothetical protein WDM89_09445 [Rhizomicrobium sp.]
MMAGLELPPEWWLNEQLEKQGKPWRVRNVRGTRFESYDAVLASSAPPPNTTVISALSVDQKRNLLTQIAPLKTELPNILINRGGTPNPQPLLGEFTEIFQRAGISVVTGFEQPSGPDETGVMIAVQDVKAIPPMAIKIQLALKNIGITTRIIPLPAEATQAPFAIFVGPAPL